MFINLIHMKVLCNEDVMTWGSYDCRRIVWRI